MLMQLLALLLGFQSQNCCAGTPNFLSIMEPFGDAAISVMAIRNERFSFLSENNARSGIPQRKVAKPSLAAPKI